MHSSVSRRRFFAFAGVAALATPGVAHAGKPQIVGAGRVREPIPDVTISSPSDFSFACDEDGGLFLCSMFGPDVGGWKGCQLMTLQGHPTPGTLEMRRGVATFDGKFDLFVFPNVFTDPPEPYLSAAAIDFTLNAVLGGPGKGRMILHVPALTETLGGDTGGILEFGRIERKRIRR